MKKLFTIITFLVCFTIAKGQTYEDHAPAGTVSKSVTIRVKTNGIDSLTDFWFGLDGNKFYRFYTAPQSWSYFSRRFKGSGKTTSDKVDIAIGDSSATNFNNFGIGVNSNGDIVYMPFNYSPAMGHILFTQKIDANAGLQTNAPFASGAGSFLKQNASTGLVEKDTSHYLKTSDLVNIYKSDGTIDSARTVNVDDKSLLVTGTVITGPNNLNTHLAIGNDGSINIGAGNITRGHTSNTKYSSDGLLQTYSDNYAGVTFDTLRMDANGASLHYSSFGNTVGFDFGNAYPGLQVKDELSQIGGGNAADYSPNIKLHPFAYVQTNMLNARADSIIAAIPASVNIYKTNGRQTDSLRTDTLGANRLLFKADSTYLSVNNDAVKISKILKIMSPESIGYDNYDFRVMPDPSTSGAALFIGANEGGGMQGFKIFNDGAICLACSDLQSEPPYHVSILNSGGSGYLQVGNLTIDGSGVVANNITPTLGDSTKTVPNTEFVMRAVAAGVSGGGFAPTSRTLTINGVAHNLTADQTWSVGTLTASNFVTAEVPSGSINSSNTAFTLANTPVSGTVQIFRNGALQIVGTDYTISGTAITYLYAPTSGVDVLRANYQK